MLHTKTCAHCGQTFTTTKPPSASRSTCSNACRYALTTKATTDEGPNPSGICQCGCGQPSAIAPRSDRKHGLVAGKPSRYAPGHVPHRAARAFWIEEDRGYDTPCWIWQGSKTKAGYGVRSAIDARGKKRPHLVHKLNWEAQNGPVPEGEELHHLCEVTSCVNPDHVAPSLVRTHRSLHASRPRPNRRLHNH